MLSHLELIHKAYYIRDIAIFCGNADYTNFLATVTIGIKCLKTSDLGWQWRSPSKVNTLVQFGGEPQICLSYHSRSQQSKTQSPKCILEALWKNLLCGLFLLLDATLNSSVVTLSS